MSDRDLTQFFIDRPAEAPTLLQLIDQLVDAHLDGLSAQADSDAEKAHAEKADEIYAEIVRRLAEVEKFGGTEATRIQAILRTGTDDGWRP